MTALKRRGTLLGLLCLTALAACAASPGPARTQTVSAGQVCTTEKPMGSHMPVRVCRTREQIEAERKAATAALNQVRTTPSVSTEQQ
ncbi:MAG: hypothetical protein RIC56_10580 [Pseudomonadales bacterium]